MVFRKNEGPARNVSLPSDRLLVVDLDNTLINRRYEFTVPWDYNLVSRLASAGWKIGLNSDTPLKALETWSERLGMNGPIIAEKGCVIKVGSEVVFKDPGLVEKFRDLLEATANALRSDGILVIGEGNPVELVREGALFGKNGETVVLLNPLRMSSMSLLIRRNDGSALAVPEAGKAREIYGVIMPLFQNETEFESELNLDYGVVTVAKLGSNKRDGTRIAMDALGVKQAGMIGDSMNDYLGKDIALHYAVRNASAEFKERAEYVARKDVTEGVLEILSLFAERING